MGYRDTADKGARKGSQNGRRTYLCDELGEFFEDFTEAFSGRRTAVVQQGGDGQWQVLADEQPLQALSYQVDSGRFDVRVVLGENTGEVFAHVIPDVSQIDFRPQANGMAEEVRFQSSNGRTDLRFR